MSRAQPWCSALAYINYDAVRELIGELRLNSDC